MMHLWAGFNIVVTRAVLVLVFSTVFWCCSAAAAQQPPREWAKQILAETGVQGGLVVHLGCGEGRLTSALCAGDAFRVHGLDIEAGNVEAARAHLHSMGRYGPVSVDTFDGKHLPYADNLVNLLVVSSQLSVDREELLRVLAPGGVAVFTATDHGPRTTGKLVKHWPDDIDEWTHWLHAADGNAVAQDTVAGPPRRMQWMAKPLWSRHHHTVPSVSAIVSARGRLFYIVDEAPSSMDSSAPDKWMLVARDALNGLPLWKKPIHDWGWKAWSAEWTCRFTVPTHLPRRLVAVGDRVYVTLGFNAPLMRQHRLFPAEGPDSDGSPLHSTAGLLDDAWFSRTRWHLNDKPLAEYLVFNTDSVYGLGARGAMSANAGFFTPGAKGYELFAADRSPAAAGKPTSANKASSRKRWSVRVPVRVTSMVLAGNTLFAAGTPDILDPKDPWAAYEGKRGGDLLALSAEDGKVLAKYQLDSPPVLDGMAAWRGRLVVSTIDGKILCYKGKDE